MSSRSLTPSPSQCVHSHPLDVFEIIVSLIPRVSLLNPSSCLFLVALNSFELTHPLLYYIVPRWSILPRISQARRAQLIATSWLTIIISTKIFYIWFEAHIIFPISMRYFSWYLTLANGKAQSPLWFYIHSHNPNISNYIKFLVWDHTFIK